MLNKEVCWECIKTRKGIPQPEIFSMLFDRNYIICHNVYNGSLIMWNIGYGVPPWCNRYTEHLILGQDNA